MQRVVGVRRGTRNGLAAVTAVVVLSGLAACTSGSGGGAGSSAPGTSGGAGSSAPGSSLPASSSANTSEASISVSAVGGTTNANPAQPVSVKVDDGTLDSVQLVNAAGKVVKGALADGGGSWRTAEPLGYAKTYTLTAKAKDDDGAEVVKTEKITTLKPDNMTQPYFNTVNGTSMDNGATYGVGMVSMVYFDEAIPDKAAAEKAMTVTTSPKVEGAWYWQDDQRALWRPKAYYPENTKVTINVKVYGKDLGKGLYGQSDQSTSFTIGQKRVTVADAKSHRVKVYFDDKLVKNYPTSMGRGGYVQGGKIALWTPPGTYTVITHENPANMSSSSYGLDANGPDGYSNLIVPWATKISTDGIYLHELNSTAYAQGNSNVSHGCLNLTTSRAKWFYQHSRVGDIVTVVHSGGPKLQVWQGGAWSVPWSEWTAGGAK